MFCIKRETLFFELKTFTEKRRLPQRPTLIYIYIYIYMGTPPQTYVFEEFTGICSVFYHFWLWGKQWKRHMPKDILEASGSI